MKFPMINITVTKRTGNSSQGYLRGTTLGLPEGTAASRQTLQNGRWKHQNEEDDRRYLHRALEFNPYTTSKPALQTTATAPKPKSYLDIVPHSTASREQPPIRTSQLIR